ncbi:pleurocidin-like peptide WF4 [Pleuronectes platessa]|uniref:pleurocidin-like peptide WF4 n=1 Tax=Pleuronectes platessa TaxID=8262 RepID=UPI00232A71FB|nr:pleurocidin-like peptide WF4 [Pleuronectes platessa]
MKFTATFILLFIFVLMVDLGEGRRQKKGSKGKGSKGKGRWLSRIGKGAGILGGAAIDALLNRQGQGQGQDYDYQQGQEYERLAKRSDDDSPSLIVFD